MGCACAAQPGAPPNGYLVNYYLTQASDSDTVPLTALGPGTTTLFTPTLFYTIPCATTDGPVANGTCTLSRTGPCTGVPHGSWRDAIFCA